MTPYNLILIHRLLKTLMLNYLYRNYQGRISIRRVVSIDNSHGCLLQVSFSSDEDGSAGSGREFISYATS